MREIKFRAWHKKKKRMYQPVYPRSNGTWKLQGFEFADSEEIVITQLPYTPNEEEIIPMQFTGLLDKEGKEIYEGDIVLVNHPDDVTGDFANTTGQVYYNERETAFMHVGHRGRPSKRMFEYCIVIGNIYENSELLE